MAEHERKCWDCGNVAIHAEAFTPHVLCKKCGSQDTRLTKRPLPPEPTASQLHSACLSVRHDYGVMSDENRKLIQAQAKEWLKAWRDAGVLQW